jgi:hypothetical protein
MMRGRDGEELRIYDPQESGKGLCRIPRLPRQAPRILTQYKHNTVVAARSGHDLEHSAVDKIGRTH